MIPVALALMKARESIVRAYNPWVDDFFKYIVGEWRQLLNAPVIFFSAAVVVGWLTYRAGRSRSKAVEEHLNERIKLRDDQISEYKDKLAGASPDEAKEHIADLQRTVKMLMPRSLTSDQISTVAAHLRKQLPGIEISVRLARDSSANDGQVYMSQIKDAFDSNGRIHSGQIAAVMGNNPATPSGLAIQVNAQHQESSRQIAEIFGAAFEAASIPFDYGYFGGEGGAHVQIFLFPRPAPPQ